MHRVLSLTILLIVIITTTTTFLGPMHWSKFQGYGKTGYEISNEIAAMQPLNKEIKEDNGVLKVFGVGGEAYFDSQFRAVRRGKHKYVSGTTQENIKNPATKSQDWTVEHVACSHVQLELSEPLTGNCNLDQRCKATRFLVPMLQVASLLFVLFSLFMPDVVPQTQFGYMFAAVAAVIGLHFVGVVVAHSMDPCFITSPAFESMEKKDAVRIAPVVLSSLGAAVSFTLTAVYVFGAPGFLQMAMMGPTYKRGVFNGC